MTNKSITIVTQGGVIQEVFSSHCEQSELAVKIVDVEDLREEGKSFKQIEEIIDLIKSDNWKIY